MKIETFSAEETYKIGEQMGREAKAGDVLCLLGDLGVGKTVLVDNLPYCPQQKFKGRIVRFTVKDFTNGLKYGK